MTIKPPTEPAAPGTRRLYYYTDLKVAKIILREMRMKFSRIDELNDMFELLGASVGDRLARYVFNELRKHWIDTLGLICFSETWRSPVMWAHYGDRHRGVCLGFDVSSEHATTVSYRPERLVAAVRTDAPAAGLDEDTVKAVLSTKFEDWAYEREWRVLGRLEDREANGFYYMDFSADMTLRDIIVGARCPEELADFAGQVPEVQDTMAVWKVRPSFEEFKMVHHLQAPMIVLRPKAGK